jgi:REP-associated tyrosine transposase
MMRIEKSLIADTWAFVVMPDHVHWLMQLRRRSTLSACVGSMKSQVASLLKKNEPGQDKVWQRGFHDHAVRRDENLMAIARYLVANPLRAGLVTAIGV